jgi:hypothetical protein
MATVAGPGTSLLHQPANAIQRALAKTDLRVTDLDLFEMNEAFASVVLASMLDLGITDDIVNVNGGAVALGHPIGASGARIVLTLVDELRRRGGGLGAAALCGGGGQGEAIIVRALEAARLGCCTCSTSRSTRVLFGSRASRRSPRLPRCRWFRGTTRSDARSAPPPVCRARSAA